MLRESHIADSVPRRRALALASIICGLAGNALFFGFDNILGLALAAVGLGLAIWAFARGSRVLAALGLLVSAPPVAFCILFALWALSGPFRPIAENSGTASVPRCRAARERGHSVGKMNREEGRLWLRVGVANTEDGSMCLDAEYAYGQWCS